MSAFSDSFDINEIAEVGEFKFGGNDFNLEDSQEELFQEQEPIQEYNLQQEDDDEEPNNLDVAVEYYPEEEDMPEVADETEETKETHRGSIFQNFDDREEQKHRFDDKSPVSFESPKGQQKIASLPMIDSDSPLKEEDEIDFSKRRSVKQVRSISDDDILTDLGDITCKTPPKESVLIQPKEQIAMNQSSDNLNVSSVYSNRQTSLMATGHNAYPTYNPEGPGKFIVECSYQKNELTNTFNVLESKMEGEHHEFKVVGTDPQTSAKFAVLRRFRHFQILRASFILKFPALYVPPLPQKQQANSTDTQLRVFLLARFVKQVALCPYLLESDEFHCFISAQDIESSLSQLMASFQQKTVMHIQALQPYYFIQGTFPEQELEQAKQQTREFAVLCKRMLSFLSNFTERIVENEQRHDKTMARMLSLNKFLYEYEQQSVESYSPSLNLYLGKNKTPKNQSSLLLFENPANANVRQNFDTLLNRMQNPFMMMRHWLKYETLELEAILEAFDTRQAIEKRLRDLITRYRDQTAELKTLQEGGYTLRSLFQSKEAREKSIQDISSSIPLQEIEIINLRIHSSIVTLQLARQGIPFFQRSKFIEFYKNVSLFSKREVANADKVLSLFNQILGLNTGLIKENVSFWREREADDNSKIISFNDQPQGEFNDF